jgi:hypothetical protein
MRTVRKPEKSLRPTFVLEEELALVDRFAAYALSVRDNQAPWERNATTYVLTQLALDMTQALRDPQMGPVLTEDVQEVDPVNAASRYCRMYAEAWLQDAEDLLSVALGKLQATVTPMVVIDAVRLVAGKPVRATDLIGREITPQTYVSPIRERCVRLAWRLWQMRVRSGEMIAEREWKGYLDAAFAELDAGRAKDLVERLVAEEFPPSQIKKPEET